MKRIVNLIIVTVCAVLFVPGCANLSPADSELLTGIVSDAAGIVLSKNQKAVPVLKSLSLGIEAALTSGTLPPEKVKAFIETLDKDSRLTPGERLLLARAIQRTQRRLAAVIGSPDVDVTNPKVRSILTEIKRNLDEILELSEAFKA